VVDAEREATRQVVTGLTVGQLRQAVLRLAALTSTDLSVLAVAGDDETVGGVNDTDGDRCPQSTGAGGAMAPRVGICGDGSVP